MRPHAPALAAAAAFASALNANPVDQIRPDAPELAPYGAYSIGVQSMTVTNPGQIDVLNVTENEEPTYDRPLTLEIWYPAIPTSPATGTYEVNLRDGETKVTLTGRAVRNAPPLQGQTFPLVILSHGYPGNRFLMTHLGENLASKGYVTVSIDHTDSTYSDQAAFGSTLLNRSVDQRFAIDVMANLKSPIGEITDAQNTAVIGYSMGGYGAVVFGGAGVTKASTEYGWGTPNGLLERHLAGSDSHEALMDSRLKAVIAIAPWGRNAGFWDATGASGLRKPTLFMAGSVDDVSVYDAMRGLFEDATGADRHLLTFENANHNAAAPIPAPLEAWKPVETLDFVPFDHYADPVWDTVRMNNITQHFATAFLDLHLKADTDKARFLDLIPNAIDGVIALDDAGKATEDHTYWNGFQPRTAVGLRFESLKKEP